MPSSFRRAAATPALPICIARWKPCPQHCAHASPARPSRTICVIPQAVSCVPAIPAAKISAPHPAPATRSSASTKKADTTRCILDGGPIRISMGYRWKNPSCCSMRFGLMRLSPNSPGIINGNWAMCWSGITVAPCTGAIPLTRTRGASCIARSARGCRL